VHREEVDVLNHEGEFTSRFTTIVDHYFAVTAPDGRHGQRLSGARQVPGGCRVIAYRRAARVVPEEISPRSTAASTSAMAIHATRLDS
jgi:hypothetical protein